MINSMYNVFIDYSYSFIHLHHNGNMLYHTTFFHLFCRRKGTVLTLYFDTLGHYCTSGSCKLYLYYIVVLWGIIMLYVNRTCIV